jgi:hypothetical protein
MVCFHKPLTGEMADGGSEAPAVVPAEGVAEDPPVAQDTPVEDVPAAEEPSEDTVAPAEKQSAEPSSAPAEDAPSTEQPTEDAAAEQSNEPEENAAEVEVPAEAEQAEMTDAAETETPAEAGDSNAGEVPPATSEAPVDDLMADLEGTSLTTKDTLMGDVTEGGEALGPDALQGALASPKNAQEGDNSTEQAGANADTEKPAAATEEEDPAKQRAEQEAAAMKIQTIHRGGQARAMVKDQKERGALPGQQRPKIVSAATKRQSEKSEGRIDFYDGIGSSYTGELMDGHPHGQGTYTFANGNVYKGEFVRGQMHGKGELRYPGYGRLVASFVDGRAQADAQFLFEDGLAYQPQGWKYCVEGDRRFYHEVVDPRFGLVDE